MLRHSDYVFGAVTDDSDTLVGLARVLTDHVYKALVFDLTMDASYRKAGIGMMFVNAIVIHPHVSQVKHTEGTVRKRWCRVMSRGDLLATWATVLNIL